jgi:hypothetical protein
MQRKLESYFKVVINHDKNHKKCFIYDPENSLAYFTFEPNAEDSFVAKKSGVKLYYRLSTVKPCEVEYPIIRTSASIPLLKSNLQKAIRRGDAINAVHTALALLQKSPNEFFRRLAIIYIEDVTLFDNYSIIVWLMMVSTDYALTNNDYAIIINIVVNLVICPKYYRFGNMECDSRSEDQKEGDVEEVVTTFSHEFLETCANHSQLLALHYRRLYGGMKGDMVMLDKAIMHYVCAPEEMEMTAQISFHIAESSARLSILDEAIDFHPFPNLLNILSRLTFINKDVLREIIWHAESGYNFRKKFTIMSSEEYKERSEWRTIEKHLKTVRAQLLVETL